MVNSTNKPKYSVPGVLLFICIAVTSVFAESAPVAVTVESAKVLDLAPQIMVPGTLVSKADATISSEINGRLTWVAQIGDTVKKGEPLAIIDNRRWLLEQQTFQTEITRLTSNLAYLGRQMKRLSKLTTTNNAAVSSLDEATMQHAMASQQLEAAKIQLQKNALTLEQTRVTAPFTGIIVERMQEPGEYTSIGSQLARLVNTEQLEISARAPLSVSRFTKNGSEVLIKGDNHNEITTVRSVIPVGDARSRMLEVRINVKKGDWVIGEAVRVALNNGATTKGIAVHRDALVLRDNATYVYRIGDDNIAQRLTVNTGSSKGDYIAVTGGLKAGDSVIIRGNERLEDGDTVLKLKSLSRQT